MASGDRGRAVSVLDLGPKSPEFEPWSDHWDFNPHCPTPPRCKLVPCYGGVCPLRDISMYAQGDTVVGFEK